MIDFLVGDRVEVNVGNLRNVKGTITQMGHRKTMPGIIRVLLDEPQWVFISSVGMFDTMNATYCVTGIETTANHLKYIREEK